MALINPALDSVLSFIILLGLRHPAMVKRMDELGYLPLANSPESFRALIQSELARWRAVATEVNLSLD